VPRITETKVLFKRRNWTSKVFFTGWNFREIFRDFTKDSCCLGRYARFYTIHEGFIKKKRKKISNYPWKPPLAKLLFPGVWAKRRIRRKNSALISSNLCSHRYRLCACDIDQWHWASGGSACELAVALLGCTLVLRVPPFSPVARSPAELVLFSVETSRLNLVLDWQKLGIRPKPKFLLFGHFLDIWRQQHPMIWSSFWYSGLCTQLPTRHKFRCGRQQQHLTSPRVDFIHTRVFMLITIQFHFFIKRM